VSDVLRLQVLRRWNLTSVYTYVQVRVGCFYFTVYHIELQVVLAQQGMLFTLCHSEPNGGPLTHVRRLTQALAHSHRGIWGKERWLFHVCAFSLHLNKDITDA
jgi:hypothetical protein